MNRSKSRSWFKRGMRAFTLVELLAVLVVIGILLAAILPAIHSMEGESFSSSVSDIATLLEQARAYAMASNNYVYVGIYEADASQSLSTYPQLTGVGRVYIGITACRDGTNGYSTEPWTTTTATNLIGINPLRRFDGVHTVSPANVATALPKMDSASDGRIDLTQSTSAAVTTFSGTNVGAGAAVNPVQTFTEVIQFTPSGGANVITSFTVPPTVAPYLQIGFITSHGNIPESTVANCAGLQIDGITGTVNVFRPGQP